jgi:hypothetical protein
MHIFFDAVVYFVGLKAVVGESMQQSITLLKFVFLSMPLIILFFLFSFIVIGDVRGQSFMLGG